MAKPITVTYGSPKSLPMERIRKSLKDVDIRIKTGTPDQWRELSDIESSLMKLLYGYFSADPAQHTEQNVWDVANYLWLSFTEEAFERPDSFDWELINELSESQMCAAQGLTMILWERNLQYGIFGEKLPELTANVAALRQAEEARAIRRAGALVKLSKDPKQAIKHEVKKLWRTDEWQKKLSVRGGQAEFARYVCNQFGVADQATVCNWCREWRKLG